MEIQTDKRKKYIKAVIGKMLLDSNVKNLQFGQTRGVPASTIRNKEGMLVTEDTILTSASNLYDEARGRVALTETLKNFSDVGGASYGDVADIKTVGGIDLTISMLSESLVPFVCVDRGMPDAEYLITYTDLVAAKDMGDIKAGAGVANNFEPVNLRVKTNGSFDINVLGTDITTAETKTYDNLGQVIPTNTTVKVINATGVVVARGQDYLGINDVINGTGTVLLGNIVANGIEDSKIEKIVISYGLGTIAVTTSAALPAGYTINISTQRDQVASNKVINLEAKYTKLRLVTQPNFINIQNSLQNMAVMNKYYSVANSTDRLAEILFNRVKNVYIETINVMVLEKMWSAKPVADILGDLTNYTLNSGIFMSTKNDIISYYIQAMSTKLLTSTNKQMTALIVNSNIWALISQVPIKYVALPQTDNGINGMVGYWEGIPVFRHNALDQVADATGAYTNTGVMFGAYRSADNQVASQVYGEFLPFTSTEIVQNYAQPTQFSQSFYSMVGTELVKKELVVRCDILLPTLFTANGDVNYPAFITSK